VSVHSFVMLLSICLSRACLGNVIISRLKLAAKLCFFAHAADHHSKFRHGPQETAEETASPPPPPLLLLLLPCGAHTLTLLLLYHYHRRLLLCWFRAAAAWQLDVFCAFKAPRCGVQGLQVRKGIVDYLEIISLGLSRACLGKLPFFTRALSAKGGGGPLTWIRPAKNASLFLSAFPMFVPSLSW
jgi:hypothetical protein